MKHKFAFLIAGSAFLHSEQVVACQDLLSNKAPFEVTRFEVRENSIDNRNLPRKIIMHVYRMQDGTTKIFEKEEYMGDHTVTVQKFGFPIHVDFYSGGKLVRTLDSDALKAIENKAFEQNRELSITSTANFLAVRELLRTSTVNYKISYVGEEPFTIGPCIINTKVYDISAHEGGDGNSKFAQAIRRYYSDELGIVLKSVSTAIVDRPAGLTGQASQTRKIAYKLERIEINFPLFPFE